MQLNNRKQNLQKFVLIFQSTILILFILWREYVRLLHPKGFLVVFDIRYLSTYCTVFAAMACYYIKQSIFQVRNTRAETIIIMIVCIVASATAITRITRLESSSDPKNFILNKYTQYVVTLFNQKKKYILITLTRKLV